MVVVYIGIINMLFLIIWRIIVYVFIKMVSVLFLNEI